ncbi:MAG TPA: Gfo/Idh/MocA family oxidoreductase [Planctomycetota bacterium]|nr:Gfo/Idh/MocA family oxidoreductase [Planctomycetota bacterium]
MSRIRIAVVGCGKVAQGHLRAWTWFPKEVEIVALVDRVREKAEAYRERFGLHDARVLTDYHELLDDESVEAIDLCTYSDLHDDQIADFMEHGKHIMTEKPVGYSLENCRKMRWYARQYPQLKVGVAYSLRYYPINIEVKRLLAEGAIGQVLHVEITHVHPHDLKGHHRNDMAARAHYGIERATDSGGRYIASSEMNHTTHPYDLTRYLLGDEPLDVFAFRHLGGTFALIRFVKGALAQVNAGAASSRGIPHVTPVLVQGTEGTLYTSWDHFHEKKKPVLKAYLVSNGKRRVITAKGHTGHGDHQRSRNFIDALRKDAPLICDMTDAVATSELLHAVWESAALEIRVPIHRRTQTG